MLIEVFGIGCSKCKRLERNLHKALEEKGVEAEVKKVDDYEEMSARGVMMTPALAIDGELRIAGRVATAKEIAEMLV